MSKRKPLVLYFTPEADMSDEDMELMNRIPGARQRNAALIDPEAPAEKCDAVAGPAIPDSYDHLPRAKPLAPVEDEEEGEIDNGFEDMKPAQLKKLLDDAGVEYPKNARTAALVALCQEHLTEEE